ncbi:MAG: histidinol-phosphate transaminase [Dehalococcoidia bacterium]
MSKESDLNKRIRPELAAMPGYEAIEPIDELGRRLCIPPERIVKLDGNENPYGPSPKALEALAGYRQYHIYPDPLQREARRALSRYLDVPFEQIVFGAGSDEIMDLILRAFLRPGDAVVNCPPTFGMYPFLTRVLGARIIDVPRRGDGFALDLAAIRAVASEAKVIFVASPNNPTGNVISEADLDDLLASGLVVVLDEAYVEFAGRSFADRVAGGANLIVLRTFSKWAGLAGLRIGYGIFPPSVAEVIFKIKQPYNLNVAAQAAMLASLEDVGVLRERVRLLVAEREELFRALAGVPYLQPIPSQANFILCRIDGVDAGGLKAELRKRGIMVRRPNAPSLCNCLRISVGLPEHRRALIDALKEIGGSRGTSR